MKEAGVTVIGGHSINDRDIKFGFAVTGIIRPSRVITNSGAMPGDALVLTKPLGTGIISFAHQIGRASHAALSAITASMTALNKTASELMVKTGAHAATDITGFGFLGHLNEMVRQSRVTAELKLQSIPVFPEALSYAQKGIISGAVERNREYATGCANISGAVNEAMESMLCDPQTSGGLLIALPEKKAAGFVTALRRKGVPAAAVVGKVTDKSVGKIILK
jgi:selenide,water dikinase